MGVVNEGIGVAVVGYGYWWPNIMYTTATGGRSNVRLRLENVKVLEAAQFSLCLPGQPVRVQLADGVFAQHALRVA